MLTDEVVREYWPVMVKYCFGLLLNYHEAEDAAQDVFVKAAGKAHGAADNLRPWLYRVAYTTCMDVLRRRRLARLFLAKHATISPVAYEDIYDTGISAELVAALAQLKPRDRALMYSRVVDDLEYAELARIYKTSEATLHKRYERARKKLAAIIKERDAWNG
jgi:RNA polymerase sigma-70 factor (ECF subfamily)